MYLSGATTKTEVAKMLKKLNEKSKTVHYSASKVKTKLGVMWKISSRKK
jgi:hypothetical protein